MEWLLASTFFTAEQTAVSSVCSAHCPVDWSTGPQPSLPPPHFLQRKQLLLRPHMAASWSAPVPAGARWPLLHREDTSLCKNRAGKFFQKERLKECPSLEIKRILWHFSVAFSDNVSTEIVLTALSQPLCLRSLGANGENRQDI